MVELSDRLRDGVSGVMSKPMLSEALFRTLHSPMRQFESEIQSARNNGVQVIELQIGGPDIPDPLNGLYGLLARLIGGWKIIRNQGYGESQGDLRLRKIIAQEYGHNLTEKNVFITVGSSEAIYFILGALVEYQERIGFLCEELSKLYGVDVNAPDGTFFVTARVRNSDTTRLMQYGLSHPFLKGNGNKTICFAPLGPFYPDHTNNSGNEELRIAAVRPIEQLEVAMLAFSKLRGGYRQ